MSNIPYWIIAILMLSLLVLVHELGHFLAGRALGFKIIEFAIGFGPKLIKWERKGIKYSIRAFPLGGFVSFFGEDAEKPDEPGAMNNMAWYKRLIVLISGVACNMLFALIITAILFGSMGKSVLNVAEMNQNSPMAMAGLQVGDEILGVNGVKGITDNHVYMLIGTAGEKDVRLLIRRNGLEKEIVADKFDINGEKKLGITTGTQIYKVNFLQSFELSFRYNTWMAEEMYKVLGQLVTGKISLNSLSGPVSTIGVIGESVKEGAAQSSFNALMIILQLLVVISVNLAIFNILPIPALDGFRMLLVIIERIRKKPINRDLEAKINFTGFAILIGLVIALELYKLFSSL